MLRAPLPYQSGIEPGWPRSQVPGWLLAGTMPRSKKKLEPGPGTPTRLMPHRFRPARIARNITVLVGSFAYRYRSLRPCLKPALASNARQRAAFPREPVEGYGFALTWPRFPGGITEFRMDDTAAPPRISETAALLTPYSMACRTSSLAMACLLFGLRRLNTTYGIRLLPGQMNSKHPIRSEEHTSEL